MTTPLAADKRPIVATVRRFVEEEVIPIASALEHTDRYPHELVLRMKGLGLFGALIPEAYGGLGLDSTTYAMVIEELCRGWMSLAGVINSHTIAALIVLNHGTEEQRRRFLSRFAAGDARGGLCLTEPHAGSDVQAITTAARRQGDRYLLTGTKMFVTNGREGNTFALLARTDPTADPPHRGMSCFIVEKGPPGLTIAKSIGKLGYKGVDTAELVFEEFPVPAANLVGGVEGRGFKHVMSGLETGRINIAARAVGVAQAALDNTLPHVRAGRGAGDVPPLLLGDMATKLTAARLLTYWAAGMKDRGERCDLEAGMAKLYASEIAQEIAMDALAISGDAGYLKTFPLERYYRDTPLMVIGEGTNEIQRLLIARNLLDRYGERPGALVSHEEEPEERRQTLLAVRQFVDKHVIPLAQESERAGAFPEELLARLAELGILGALVPQEAGGAGLDLAACAMLVEELARGSATVAGIVASHLTVAGALARFGTAEQRARWLPALARGDILGSQALTHTAVARERRGGWALTGTFPLVVAPDRAGVFAVLARLGRSATGCFLVERQARGVQLGVLPETLGGRGLDLRTLRLVGARVPTSNLLGQGGERGPDDAPTVLAMWHVGIAATGVGLAQAAFEAALRYSQQRVAFGKPICQHQAIQLKLADMATLTTAARLVTYHAADRLESAPPDGALPGMARLLASEAAYAVALEAMRIHGGYGYTTEFPVERYYRDAPLLRLLGRPDDEERRLIAGGLLGHPASAP